MIGRRTFLGWLSGFIPQAVASTSVDRIVIDDPWLDPKWRLGRLRWQFECRARHKWEVQDAGNWTYAGAGWGNLPVPTGREGCYEHRYVCGEGATAIETIDDWYAKLPTEQFDILFWRVKPELTSETDFDTKRTRWRIFSRFAMVPLGDDS